MLHRNAAYTISIFISADSNIISAKCLWEFSCVLHLIFQQFIFVKQKQALILTIVFDNCFLLGKLEKIVVGKNCKQ